MKSRRTDMLSRGLLVLCLVSSLFVYLAIPAIDAFAQFKESLAPVYSRHSPLPLISNDFISLSVEAANGLFTLGTTGGDPGNPNDNNKLLLYGHPWPWSSFTTIRIDGTDYQYGSESGSFTLPPTNYITYNKSVWVSNQIQVTQTLSLVENPSTGRVDNLEIRYLIVNNDTQNHTVGVRVLLDTMLGSNDGAPFQVPGFGAITTEMEISIPVYWQAFDNLSNPSVISQGTLIGGLATRPDRFILASWPDIYGTDWDYTATAGKIFGDTSYPDSAVALYWNPVQIGPNQAVEYITFYGLSAFNTVPGPLTVSITGPLSIEVIDGAYSPNPFPVIAYVQNTTNFNVTNLQVTIDLPSGLSLESGSSQTQTLAQLNIGQTHSFTWNVRAADRIESQTLTYTVRSSATSISEASVQRSVLIPALLLVYDTGFLPNPNGYQFKNFSIPTLTWDLFRCTFGTDETEINGQHRVRAQAFYEDNFRNYAGGNPGGSCFGMSSSSSLLYYTGRQAWDLGDNRNSSLNPFRNWGVFADCLGTVTDFIETYQGRWSDQAVSAAFASQSHATPNSVYQDIKSQMASGRWNDNPRIIVIWEGVSGESSGHAMVPYRIEEQGDHSSATMFVYDNNHPYVWWWGLFGQNRYSINFDLRNHQWSYGDLNWANGGIQSIPLNSVLAEPSLADYKTIQGAGHLLFTDDSGRRLGYEGNMFFNEIPGATKVVPPGQGIDIPETYFLLEGIKYRMEILGTGTGSISVNVFGPNSLVQLDASVDANTRDQFEVNNDGKQIILTTNDQNKVLAIMIDRELPSGSRSFSISNMVLKQETIILHVSDDDRTLIIQNQGNLKTYNIKFEQTGLNPCIITNQGVQIGQNQTHYLTLQDWEHPDTSKIVLGIDFDSDGNIDQELLLFRVSGGAYFYPENPTYRASFSMDVSGPSSPSGWLKYYYTRTRMNFVSTGITSAFLSGNTATISGTGTVNGVGGYTFTATMTNGSPDTFGIVIKKSDGTIYYSVGPKNISGGDLVIQ
jgi:hypothetical protein